MLQEKDAAILMTAHDGTIPQDFQDINHLEANITHLIGLMTTWALTMANQLKFGYQLMFAMAGYLGVHVCLSTLDRVSAGIQVSQSGDTRWQHQDSG